MKSVLCFGDSNTWGWIPGPDGGRYPFERRWPGILQNELGPGCRVVEEALNGRMTVWDDPYEVTCKNGRRHLPVALDSHAPIDLVILMLGTNDLKHHRHLTAEDIAFGAGLLVDMILASGAGPAAMAPGILLVAPARLAAGECPFGHLFDGALEKSKGFAAAYASIAAGKGVAFLDAAQVAESSPVDCIHLDDKAHRRLGLAIAGKVAEIL